MNNDNTLCGNFENNIMLFIDRELPVYQFNELNSHVHNCKICSILLSETIDIIYSGKNNQLDIQDDLLDAMIEKSVKKGRSKFSIIKNPFSERKERKMFYWKIAFASVLVFASITISLLTNRANPVKQVSRELLDWEGTKIETELSTVNHSINLISNEEWNSKVNQIDQRLNQLKKQTDKFSFN